MEEVPSSENFADHQSNDGLEKGIDGELTSNNTKEGCAARLSRHVALHPWKYLIGSFTVALGLSVAGLIGGGFKIEVENQGWRSRGTQISDRQVQIGIIMDNQEELFNDQDGSVWDDLIEYRTKGWNVPDRRRRTVQMSMEEDMNENTDVNVKHKEEHPSLEFWNTNRNLLTGFNESCLDTYTTPYIVRSNTLMAAWKVDDDLDVYDSNVLLEICKAEENTMALMDRLNTCTKCGGTCLPPQSLILALREFTGAFNGSCEDLLALYTPTVKTDFINSMVTCVEEVIEKFDVVAGNIVGNITDCPSKQKYGISFVETKFGANHIQMTYTSSYFPTVYEMPGTDKAPSQVLYEHIDDLDRGKEDVVKGAYDTVYDDFEAYKSDELITKDMILAVGSFFITAIAMMIHTQSVWLTVIGLFQIGLSFPLAYFFYVFFARLKFFPFLNFIGVFVVAALGADDVFVAVDKWKNARLAAPRASTGDVAAVALPNAAGAMFLTTSTTAVAFFATAICPVAPILCFAVFCGLLIVLDYALNIILVFPALCLYDKWLMEGKRNCCISCCFGKREKESDKESSFKEESEVADIENSNNDGNNESFTGGFIHKVLTGYYNLLHKFRWPVFVLCLVAIGLCAYFASTFSLPKDSEVRLLRKSFQQEQNYVWSKNLLYNELMASGGSNVRVIWGLEPADNGNKNDPESMASLHLDDKFDPTSQEAQVYLRDFCDRFFATDFALLPQADYRCPINVFDDWLAEQAALPSADTKPEYGVCNGEDSLPMTPDVFSPCFIAWSEIDSVLEDNVLDNNGKLQILMVKAQATAQFDDPYSDLNREFYKYEDWLKNERKNVAPAGVNDMYHTSHTFWWYDTNGRMLETALGAAAIAIAFSTVIVFLSSRSLHLTAFSTVSVCYVLAATTACLVGLGWTLGFLESICFAILIGISCDFVIHIGHAYSHFEGSVSREVRTKYAILHMGPSILAAAGTTFAAAALMLFCKLTFFTKFAMILFMTILHSTIATFVVFVVMADIFGPSEPTQLVDRGLKKMAKCCKKKETTEE